MIFNNFDPILNAATRKDGPFIISNGQQVDEYLDMYRVLLQPSYRADILSRMQKRLFDENPRFHFIAGRETAGALLASLLAYRLNVPSLVIRGSIRDHGTCEKIEKPTDYKQTKESVERNLFPEYFMNVVLIDDVTSAGIGLEDSILKLRDEGFNPVLAYSIVYRGLGGHKIAEKLGVPFEYLIYHSENVHE